MKKTVFADGLVAQRQPVRNRKEFRDAGHTLWRRRQAEKKQQNLGRGKAARESHG
jgi:hypothetical protein